MDVTLEDKTPLEAVAEGWRAEYKKMLITASNRNSKTFHLDRCGASSSPYIYGINLPTTITK